MKFYVYAGGIKKATSGSIFYGNACLALYLFIRLARRWPKLAADWKAVEISMAKFEKPTIGWKVTIMTAMLFTLAFGKVYSSLKKFLRKTESSFHKFLT